MSTRTKAFNLVKPQLSDPADITMMNENWDSLDDELVQIGTEIIELQTAVDDMITASTEDLVAGESPLITGRLYLVYE